MSQDLSLSPRMKIVIQELASLCILLTGPMFCGKTDELLRLVDLLSHMKRRLVLIRPTRDTRDRVAKSRSGRRQRTFVYLKGDDIAGFINLINEHDIICIDEFQFFSPEFIPVIQEAMRNGKQFLIAGLDTDFRAIPFPITLKLMSIPEVEIFRYRAVCHKCRKYNATRSQRLVNGKPASRDEEVFVVENAKKKKSPVCYQARCVHCHEVA